jgi:protein-S-isoprenylcysteine O-methyltransferase Ste14
MQPFPTPQHAHAPGRGRAIALGLTLNVALPLVLMGCAWSGNPRAFYASWVRALAALLFVLPNLAAIVFTTGYGPHARASGESPWVLASANLVSNLGMLGTIFLDSRATWRMPGPDALRYFGLAVFALGTALRVATMLALGRMFSLRVSVEEDHRLVTTGLYRRVRHPSYTSVVVLCVGIAFVFRSWFWALLIPAMFYGLTRRMATEERFLLAHFGEDYRAYMARTKRLLPGIY